MVSPAKLASNAVSAADGFVPFVCDVIRGVFKANSRNVALAREFLRIRGENFLKTGGVVEGLGREGKEGPGADPGGRSDWVEQERRRAGQTWNRDEWPGNEAFHRRFEPEPLTATKGTHSSSGSTSFSIFGSRSKKGKNATAAGDGGRFVEDVGPMPGSLADASSRR
ncbi:hypothetical protein D9613_011978 [Agrocybe pediades]|uniref:Uncharacterized protein n=1 Tax=Agrocybe pediades TaxID=84607 RepID=A0A8H4QER5_9AGAR|nr:hypothetical protein D9613_011978 [Agrocybe pediades]